MNRVSNPITLALFAAIVCFTANLSAKNPIDSRLKLKNDRVIVFKDGYAMVVKRGTATTDENGLVYIDEVPDAAILGSFWAIPDRGKIKSMVAGWTQTDSKTDRELNCTNTIEIIKANLGKRCTVVTSKNETLEGKLLKILSNDDQSDWPRFRTLLSSTAPTTAQHQNQEFITPITGEWFILRTDEGDMMLATKTIKKLIIADMTSTITRTTIKRTRKKRLSLKFDQPNQEIKIHLMYFRPDVRWIPTYRINLTDKHYQTANKNNSKANSQQDTKYKTAEIFMQGELINDAEDFIDVPFHVVVGVPNFRFRNVSSPMVLEKNLRSALAQAIPNLDNGNNQFFNNMSNAIFTQRSGQPQPRGTNATEQAVDFSQEIATNSGNDLFVYELENMPLKKGERAMSPIIRTNAAYRDVYTWDVVIPRAASYSATSAASTSPLVLNKNSVWRQIELINNTKIPWTTGAAMFTDGFLPLAQELLTYTSPGGTCRVPVTVAVDLKGTAEDSETSRKLDALTWRGYRYAKVKGQAGLTLTNRKQEPIDVEISLRFGGKATDASDGGAIKLDAYRGSDWRHNGDAINNSSLIKWTTRLDPQKSFQPVSQYEYFIRY